MPLKHSGREVTYVFKKKKQKTTFDYSVENRLYGSNVKNRENWKKAITKVQARKDGSQCQVMVEAVRSG